jgi:hypothetical protein
MLTLLAAYPLALTFIAVEKAGEEDANGSFRPKADVR